jgi:hypothetical protein
VLRVAGRGLEIPPRVADKLQDLHPLIDENARRRVARQEQPIEVPGHVDVAHGRRRAGGGACSGGDRMHLGPGSEVERAHRRGPDEDLVVLVDRGEVLSEAGEALRAAKEKEPTPPQRVVQGRKDPTLERQSEVDEYVPAGHEIELRERRVACEIVPDEDAQLADVLVDAIPRLDLVEEAPAPFLADVAHDRVGVGALAGGLDGALADVRAEDLDGMASGRVVQELEQSDGERVQLFPGRAPGDPEADGLSGRFVLQDLRKDRGLQTLEDVRIAKERGDMDENLVVQTTGFLGVAAKQRQVVAQALDPQERHPAREPPLERRSLVLAEVDAERISHQAEDLVEDEVVAGRSR